jgi:hypothetical protein
MSRKPPTKSAMIVATDPSNAPPSPLCPPLRDLRALVFVVTVPGPIIRGIRPGVLHRGLVLRNLSSLIAFVGTIDFGVLDFLVALSVLPLGHVRPPPESPKRVYPPGRMVNPTGTPRPSPEEQEPPPEHRSQRPAGSDVRPRSSPLPWGEDGCRLGRPHRFRPWRVGYTRPRGRRRRSGPSHLLPSSFQEPRSRAVTWRLSLEFRSTGKPCSDAGNTARGTTGSAVAADAAGRAAERRHPGAARSPGAVERSGPSGTADSTAARAAARAFGTPSLDRRPRKRRSARRTRSVALVEFDNEAKRGTVRAARLSASAACGLSAGVLARRANTTSALLSLEGSRASSWRRSTR